VGEGRGCAVRVVSGAAVSTVQVRVSGEGSTLPTASLARTAKVWLPSPRPVKEVVEEQGAKAAPSRLQLEGGSRLCCW